MTSYRISKEGSLHTHHPLPFHNHRFGSRREVRRCRLTRTEPGEGRDICHMRYHIPQVMDTLKWKQCLTTPSNVDSFTLQLRGLDTACTCNLNHKVITVHRTTIRLCLHIGRVHRVISPAVGCRCRCSCREFYFRQQLWWWRLAPRYSTQHFGRGYGNTGTNFNIQGGHLSLPSCHNSGHKQHQQPGHHYQSTLPGHQNNALPAATAHCEQNLGQPLK